MAPFPFLGTFFFLEWRFVPVSWRFLGYFPSVAMFCPGNVGFFGTFLFRSSGLSRFCGAFQDIFLSRCVFSRFYRPNKDVLLLPEDFLLELWGFSGHFPFAVRFVPVLPPKQGCFVAPRRFSPGIVLFSGTFFFRGVLSGLINIILLSVCGFIIFAPQNLTK